MASTLDQVKLVVSKRVTKQQLTYNAEFEEKRNQERHNVQVTCQELMERAKDHEAKQNALINKN